MKPVSRFAVERQGNTQNRQVRQLTHTCSHFCLYKSLTACYFKGFPIICHSLSSNNEWIFVTWTATRLVTSDNEKILSHPSCRSSASFLKQKSNSLSGFSFWFRLSTPRQTCGLADCGSLAGQVPHYNWACAPQQQPRQRQHQARPAPGCQPTCHLQEDIHTNITSDTHTHTCT